MWPCFADVGEADRLRLDLCLLLLLEVGQPEILEDQRGQLVDGDLRLVVVDARLVARLRPCPCPSALWIWPITSPTLLCRCPGPCCLRVLDRSGIGTPRASGSAP